MEAIIASGQDQRIPELDVSIYQNQASYVIKREQTTNTCAIPVIKSNSVRTAKLSIVDGNFLDLSTLHFSFLVRNNSGTHVLRPASAIPSCWFRRMIVKVNGATVEDVQNTNKLEQQISMFVATNKKRNWGDVGSGWENFTDAGTDALPKTIPAATAKRVTWRPLSSGFLSCGKYLPMLGGAAGGLSIELEVCDLNEAVVDFGTNSTDWQIEQLQVHVDSVQLTSEMTSNFADMLIRGESILIPYQANNCDVQYLNGGANQVLSLAKQFSRLSTVFVSLEDNIVPSSADNSTGVHDKAVNKFYLAAGSSETIESYITVNNQRWPQFSTIGTKHHFMRLLQCLGVLNSVSHSVNISATGYGDGTLDSRQFVIGFDLEAIPHAEGTGVSVQGGGVVQVSILNCGAPQKAYIATHFDSVLEIRSQGAIVYS
jgi:hypothetical protein